MTVWGAKRWFAVVVAGALMGAGCGPAQPEARPLKLALVGEGNIEDDTYNKLVFEGAKRAADEFQMEFDYVASQYGNHGADITYCAEKGYDHVIAVSFLMTADAERAAAAFPDVDFSLLDSSSAQPPENLLGLTFREDQGGYLAGVLAGMR